MNDLDFFKEGKYCFKSYELFKKSKVCSFLENILGELVETNEKNTYFIGVDSDGVFHNEIYYPKDIQNKIKTVIPKNLKNDFSLVDDFWKKVDEKGYAIIENIDIPLDLDNEITNESFIPYGLNLNYSLSETIYFPYFISKANYEKVEEHNYPKYLYDLIDIFFKYIPSGSPLVNSYKLGTPDLTKYVFVNEETSDKGPYQFHCDYKSRLAYMLFSYFPKNEKIVGRELILGKVKDLKEIKDPSQPVDPSNVDIIDTIDIKKNMLIVVNTLNPSFVHKVNKLKEDNEIVFLNTNVWVDKLV